MQKPEKKEGYLSPKRLLPTKEYKEYRKTKENIERMNIKRKFGELKQEEKYRTRQQNYSKTTGGRISGGIAKTFGFIRAPVQTIYRQQGQLPPQSMMGRTKTVSGYRTGKKGRPKGTVDPRYAQYGGVHGYRKWLAMKNREMRLQQMRKYQVTPQQDAYLRQLEARQAVLREDPERRTIPNTYGKVPLRSIQDEINSATHIFD